MTFIARYTHRTGVYSDYFKTIYADSINEATKQADKQAANGYQLMSLKQNVGAKHD